MNKFKVGDFVTVKNEVLKCKYFRATYGYGNKNFGIILEILENKLIKVDFSEAGAPHLYYPCDLELTNENPKKKININNMEDQIKKIRSAIGTVWLFQIVTIILLLIMLFKK